jgi:hypothetical protein
MADCPVCGIAATIDVFAGFQTFQCARCGPWRLDAGGSEIGSALLAHKLGGWDRASTHRRSRLSHLIRRQQSQNEDAVWVPVQELESWRLDDPLPSPSRQLDELILLIGECQPSPAETAEIRADAALAWIGSLITREVLNAGLDWLLLQQAPKGLIEEHGRYQPDEIVLVDFEPKWLLSLRMAGWDRYEALKRAEIVSRTAFMAMQFGDAELNHVVDNYFKPAVERADFELRVLSDRQPAGSIDDQLRVALRTSRFVIADLTHGNNGAYWEAGFAEGLSHPVIYTCRKPEWDERKTHFDTNHLVTIIWEPDQLEDAGTRLTATIRATLPGEARLTD